MNGTSAAWGGGPREGGGRYGRTADLTRLKWCRRLRPPPPPPVTWICRRTKFRGGGNGTARLCLASCKAGVVGGVERGVRGDQTLLLLTYPKFPYKDFGLPPA